MPRRAALVGVVSALALGLLSWVAPTATAAPARTLVFATWNVCKLDCPSPAPGWGTRRDRVARVIARSGADVLGIDEATNNRYRGRTQWEDVQRLARSAGYASPAIEDDQCRFGCEHTARLLFRKSTVRQVDFPTLPSAGYWRVGDINPGIGFDLARQMTWAYLQGTDGTGPFLAVAAHLTNDKSAAGERHRTEFGKALTAWADGMNASRGLPGAPVVLMADLNSFDERQPRGVQRILRDDGWRDAHSAPTRRNIDIHTVNYGTSGTGGWPKRPPRNATGVANRIDYVLYRGPVKATRYEVVVWLRGDGSFDPAYQGSDHNLVRATLSFTGQSTSAEGGAPTAEPPVAALGSGRPMPSGYPFPESTMPVEIVVSWLPGGNGKSSRTFPLRVRSDGTSVQAFESVSRTWVTVPYVNRGGLLVFSAKRLRELGLEADPLGSALPPPDSLNWLYYP